MGSKKKGNGHGKASSKRSTAVRWLEPPPVAGTEPKPVQIGIHDCGREGVYTGMMQLAPGHDQYLVSFNCDTCTVSFNHTMDYESARKIRVRGYALQGVELCTVCGDPLLNKKGEPHQHDDKKTKAESA
jgi:hypothetical protein